MRNQGGICSKSDIKKKFNWSDQKISLKTSVSDKIISWGRNKFRVIDDWVSENDIKETKKIISMFFKEQGFITENQLYEEAQFSITLYKLIDYEQVDTADKFRSIFRPFINHLKGTSIFITPEDSGYNSIEDVLLEKYSSGITRDELYEYLRNELLYRESTATQIIDKLISGNKMFEIDLGFLYPTRKLNISDNIIDELLKYIEQQKQAKPYIILKELKGYRGKLPKINVEWTPYLIRQILINNGYKNIKIFNNDYRTDQLILIEEDHAINYIDELLYIILKNEYKGKWHESFVADYLEREGFLYKKRYKREKIPISLYKNSKLIEVNELGIVELVGD